MNTGARWLKRGDTFDPEDHRMTHRLRVARSILAGQGITPTHDHDEDCRRHPSKLSNVLYSYRERVCCSCGRDERGSDWPEWVTDEIFEHAFRLADEIQDARGGYHRAAASRAKARREH